jgi:carbonic anhydrase/acetyltransferase-like protein (isoleucine patch superfamily)
MPGTRIGNGAVIGAQSVVTKSVPDFAIFAGVPAKLIRYRFSSDQIALLNRVAWWDWDDDTIRENLNCLRKPEVFFDKFRSF